MCRAGLIKKQIFEVCIIGKDAGRERFEAVVIEIDERE